MIIVYESFEIKRKLPYSIIINKKESSMANRSINTSFFLQIALALVLITFGLLAVNGYNSTGAELLRGVNKMFGKSGNVFPIVFGIVQLLAGFFLAAELFAPIPGNLFRILHIIICVFWLISIVMNFFMSDLLKPDLLRWLAALSPQLVILLSLWSVGERK